MRLRLFIGICLCWCVLTMQAWAVSAEISAISRIDDGEAEVLLIHSGAPLNFSSYWLGLPPRLVVEFAGVRLQGNLPAPAGRYIKALAAEAFGEGAGGTRLVITLPAPCEFSARPLNGGLRLALRPFPGMEPEEPHDAEAQTLRQEEPAEAVRAEAERQRLLTLSLKAEEERRAEEEREAAKAREAEAARVAEQERQRLLTAAREAEQAAAERAERELLVAQETARREEAMRQAEAERERLLIAARREESERLASAAREREETALAQAEPKVGAVSEADKLAALPRNKLSAPDEAALLQRVGFQSYGAGAVVSAEFSGAVGVESRWLDEQTLLVTFSPARNQSRVNTYALDTSAFACPVRYIQPEIAAASSKVALRIKTARRESLDVRQTRGHVELRIGNVP